ncbi:MAG: hypothetical protein ACRDHY_03870 [Anaerolineales bacterium]
MDDKSLHELTAHIRSHVAYPVTKKDFLAACENMAHVPADSVEWVAKTLPDKTYQSSEEILHTLNLPHTH